MPSINICIYICSVAVLLSSRYTLQLRNLLAAVFTSEEYREKNIKIVQSCTGLTR